MMGGQGPDGSDAMHAMHVTMPRQSHMYSIQPIKQCATGGRRGACGGRGRHRQQQQRRGGGGGGGRRRRQRWDGAVNRWNGSIDLRWRSKGVVVVQSIKKNQGGPPSQGTNHVVFLNRQPNFAPFFGSFRPPGAPRGIGGACVSRSKAIFFLSSLALLRLRLDWWECIELRGVGPVLFAKPLPPIDRSSWLIEALGALCVSRNGRAIHTQQDRPFLPLDPKYPPVPEPSSRRGAHVPDCQAQPNQFMSPPFDPP